MHLIISSQKDVTDQVNVKLVNSNNQRKASPRRLSRERTLSPA